ncbi:MAG: type IX secretion system membrane protein PorP/SprF [Flavobacteriales bacterium]|nr:MAG: type IX secretion system membrane protein PorP/SprF [Flavobacteriales bacterium]
MIINNILNEKLTPVVLLVLSLQFSIFNSKAQDIHFTMYDAMPVTTNPASAGVFNGAFRGVLNYRNQWAGIGNAYNTYAVMVDGGILKNNWRNGYLGLGLGAYRDIAGENKLGTTKINLALSSVLYLNDKNSASVGLLGSWAQNSISSENMRWDSQFNGQTFDPMAPSLESFQFENTNYFDYSAGALWAYGESASTLSSFNNFTMQAGIAFYHVTRPSRQLEFGDLDRLYSRWAIHAESVIGLFNSKWALKPKLFTYFQGPARQITGGILGRYMIKEESKYTGIFKEMAISFGTYFRLGDAIAPSVEFETSGLAVGVSYDMNISDLSVATGGNGGPEIYLKYVFIPYINGKGTKSNARFN